MRSILFILVGVIIGLGAGHALFNTEKSTEPSTVDASSMQAHGAMSHAMLEIDKTKPIPNVSIDVMPDSKDGYNIHVTTRNYSFTPESAGDAPIANTGHAHLFVNGTKVARVYGEWIYVGPELFREGTNVIQVTLNANDHSEWAIDGMHIAAEAKVER